MRELGRAWACVVALIVAALSADASGACHNSTCTEELRACRGGCAELRANDRRRCAQGCRDRSTCTAPGARARVLTWVQNECDLDAQGMATFSQRLMIRRGNCDPVTAMELPTVGPGPDPLIAVGGLCPLYAQFRAGAASGAIGLFQRISGLPDGSGVVFELTNDYSILASSFPEVSPEPPVEEGIYFVRTDGTGLRRLGPQTGVPNFVLRLDPTSSVGFTVDQTTGTILGLSPSSRSMVVTGTGPGPDGEPAPQIFVTEITTGGRTQLTHLPNRGPEGLCCPLFGDERTIFFFGRSEQRLFSVKTDGTGLAPLPVFEALPGSVVVPRFAVAGDGAKFLSAPREVPLKKTYGETDIVFEMFRVEGNRALQLTAFAYPDTGYQNAPGRDGVFFVASADPLGRNPGGVCQLFAIGPLGEKLRQLTRFPYDGRPKSGCFPAAGGSCTINGLVQDPHTGVVAVVSSCDPLGRNPDGEQGFMMRPDGTGLRQVTSFRGAERLPDGSVHVELGGPWGYSALLF